LLVFLEVDINESARNILNRISNEENGMISYEERMKIVKYANNYYKTDINDIIDSPLELNLYKQFNYLYHKNIYNTFTPLHNKIYLSNRLEINNFINTFTKNYPENYSIT
jgi:hypothetical protein